MPITNKLFGGSINLLQSALNLRMEKQGLIQSNIANIETPGYKMKDFSFGDAMQVAMQEQGRVARTNSKHMQPDPLEASASMSFSSEGRPVDLDEEMLKLSENQLMFQVAAQITAKKFVDLRTIIDEGGK
jgi:flagellar basal-body rod protein FlgB